MYEVIRYARGNGFRSLRLLASENNIPANRIYSDITYAIENPVE